jgi:hypothetical protein
MEIVARYAKRNRVEKRSQLIENTLEQGSFFMKLRAPQALGRQTGSYPH